MTVARHRALPLQHPTGPIVYGADQRRSCLPSNIQTAKLNGVEPYAWLKATLEAIAAGHPNSRIDDLLPWTFDSLSS